MYIQFIIYETYYKYSSYENREYKFEIYIQIIQNGFLNFRVLLYSKKYAEANSMDAINNTSVFDQKNTAVSDDSPDSTQR